MVSNYNGPIITDTPYNGSRRNLLVASIMDLQVMYVNARGMRYKYM